MINDIIRFFSVAQKPQVKKDTFVRQDIPDYLPEAKGKEVSFGKVKYFMTHRA